MNKRRIILAALAVCLVAAIAAGSLAYFTKERSITNDFMVASYDPDNPYDDPDDIFDILVDETNPADPTGARVSSGTVPYENIKPGDTRVKDPTVHNAGLYDEYVRMTVKLTNAANWKAAIAKWAAQGADYTDLSRIFGGFNSNFERKEIVDDVANDSLSYVYYLNHVLTPGSEETLFETVTIPAEFDNDDMLSLQEFKLEISADAIQAANTANNAYDAFQTYWAVNNPTP